jgi:hypothetical protein
MSRRSRSQRPQKARNSEAPAPDVPSAAKMAALDEDRSREPSVAPPLDELAALDAGWDDLMT